MIQNFLLLVEERHFSYLARKVNVVLCELICPKSGLEVPLQGVPPLLQPVGHALLQAREEVSGIMEGFPEKLLWERPAGAASVGFHLQHLTGVLDRLFTYAKGLPLNPEQLAVTSA